MLAEYAKENGYQIGLKMRLRGVSDIDDLPLTHRERNFTFTARLDFVAFDAETHLACARRRVRRTTASDR
jgi:hypothetical protein